MFKQYLAFAVGAAVVLGGSVLGVSALTQPDYYHVPADFSYGVLTLEECPQNSSIDSEEWDSCWNKREDGTLHVHHGVSFTGYTVHLDGRNQWDSPYLWTDAGQTAVILQGV